MVLQEREVSKDAVNAVTDLEHAAKIASAMCPDPKEWAYNGKSYEVEGFILEKCACGHPIRQVFVIERERDGKTLNIGSTCIEVTVPVLIENGAEVLASRLLQAKENLEKEIAIRKKQKRDAEASHEVQILTEEYDALRQYVKDQRESLGRGFNPYYIYHGVTTTIKAMTTPGRTAASIRTKYVDAWLKLITYYVVGYHDQFDGRDKFMPMIPVPTEPKLLKKLSDFVVSEYHHANAMSFNSWGADYESKANKYRKIAEIIGANIN